jgi:hypothetical protein
MEADYRFLSAGLYMSYMVYHATGEGVMSCIAVAGSKQAAEHLMKGKLPEHYHRAIVTRLLDSALDEDAKKMLQWIPGPTKNILVEIPREAGEYYAEMYYNLA